MRDAVKDAMKADIDVLVHEVGPRDGLQATDVMMPTAGKLEWIEALKQAGLRKIQVGSFVPPKLLPQMADSAEVVAASRAMGGFEVSALVPNLKGAENALRAGADQLNFVVSASEAHNLKNVRRTMAQSVEEFHRIVELRESDPAYADVVVSGGMATCFGCTISGSIEPGIVFDLAGKLVDAGADRIGVADTVGYANPAQVKLVFSEILDIASGLSVGAHFHDTRGLGLANALAALDAGVRELDGCLGGLGGCPFAPGASGNVVTEDLVFMLESMGFRTGVNLDKLLVAREVMTSYLGNEPVYGAYVKAGAPKGFQPATVFH